MSAQVCLKVGLDVGELPRVVEAVEKLGEQEEWSPKLVFRVNLVLEELGINIMSHGEPGSPDFREIEIILTSEADTVTIEVIDGCQPFNPLTDARTPDVEAPLANRRIGGLGIYFAQTMMDDMRYQREEGKNHVTLVTRRSE